MIANSIVMPVGIDFKTWATQIQQDLPNLVVPLPDTVDTWQDWANQLISVNELWNAPLATKIVFGKTEDWRRWANYFVETIYLT